MILWDKILENPSERSEINIKKAYGVKIANTAFKYPLRDPSRHLRGKDVKISVKVEYMPYVGLFSFIKFH